MQNAIHVGFLTRQHLPAQNGDVIEVNADTVAIIGTMIGTLVTMLGALVGLHVLLSRKIERFRLEFKHDIAELRTELKDDIVRLDDRVYALAAGLRPIIESLPDRAR